MTDKIVQIVGFVQLEISVLRSFTLQFAIYRHYFRYFTPIPAAMLSCYCVCARMFPDVSCDARPRSSEITWGRSWADSLCDLQALQGSEQSSSSLTEPFGIGVAQADLSIPRGKLRVEACGCNNISGTRENVKENSLGKRQNDSEGKGYIAWRCLKHRETLSFLFHSFCMIDLCAPHVTSFMLTGPKRLKTSKRCSVKWAGQEGGHGCWWVGLNCFYSCKIV